MATADLEEHIIDVCVENDDEEMIEFDKVVVWFLTLYLLSFFFGIYVQIIYCSLLYIHL